MLTSSLSSEHTESRANEVASNSACMCDTCGIQMANVTSLKLHLIDQHSGGGEGSQQIKLDGQNEVKSPPKQQQKQQALVSSSSNTKLSSIIAAAKNVAPCADTSKKSSFVINIPQTMKVFNVKEIMSKLKSLKKSSDDDEQQTTALPCEPQPSKTSIIQLDELNEPNYHQLHAQQQQFLCHGNDTNDLNNSEQHQLQQQPYAIDSPVNQLPYHYSECENIYICNLCHCAYDSLRSIKAHLWKHSGHHKFSYPIHDYNSRSKFINLKYFCCSCCLFVFFVGHIAI